MSEWHYIFDGHEAHSIYNADDDLIAEVVEGGGFAYDKAASHAQLIAAAPELLAALRGLMWRFQMNSERDIIAARAAIAATEKETP